MKSQALFKSNKKKERHFEAYQIRKVMMLLLSGVHPKNALLDALEGGEVETRNEASSRLLGSLKCGLGLESGVYKSLFYLTHPVERQILRRLVVYERTGSEIVLLQLEEDLRQLQNEKMNEMIVEIGKAGLAAMMPTMILLVMFLILLVTPMMLGGMMI